MEINALASALDEISWEIYWTLILFSLSWRWLIKLLISRLCSIHNSVLSKFLKCNFLVMSRFSLIADILNVWNKNCIGVKYRTCRLFDRLLYLPYWSDSSCVIDIILIKNTPYHDTQILIDITLHHMYI